MIRQDGLQETSNSFYKIPEECGKTSNNFYRYCTQKSVVKPQELLLKFPEECGVATLANFQAQL